MKFDRTTATRKHLNRASQLLQLTLIAVLIMLFDSGNALAISDFLNIDFLAKYPSSSSVNAGCQLCHQSASGGTNWNAYGWAIRQRLVAGRSINQAFGDVESTNSDVDPGSFSNFAEITANTQPGWTPGPNNTIFRTSGTTPNQNPPASLTNLDPTSALPTVTIAANLPNASETGPTAGQFTVSRTGSTAASLTVNYTRGGTAANTTDYATLSGSVIIAAGSATALINVTPVDDTAVEGSETVILTLSANAAYTVGAPSSATVTIADNDSPPTLPTVSITANQPNASETGPTAGQFTVSRTGSTAASLTVNYTRGGTAANTTDYATLSGSVIIAAGSATALINVTPVDDTAVEGSETVILTLSANAAYTVGAPSSATVTIADNDSTPTPTGPQIALSTAKLDFGQAQINTTATRTASVHNIGDATLEVTGTTRCSGTSSEYTWSPNAFTVTPGSSHLLTVFYKPTNQSSDNGCLQIASNDTTQNPEILGLAGVGTIPSVGPVLDIDISKFSATNQVNLMRPKPVQIQVAVKNPGSVGGAANVTVVGIQNNVEVYNEIQSVTLNPRSSKRLAFPSYITSTDGDIIWTVTVSDADPDFDEATATTKVFLGGNGNHGGGGDDDHEDD